MRTFVIIGCGKTKQPAGWRGPIVDLYTGPLYLSRLAAARALGGPHFILSAVHHLTPPDRKVEPYNFVISEMSALGRRRWAESVAQSLIRRGASRVIALASAAYVLPWRTIVEREGVVVETPLAGLGIGEQRAKCAEIVRAA